MAEKIKDSASLKPGSSIDLSKIKNLEAMNKAGEVPFTKTKEKITNQFIPTETMTIPLPSKGLPYKLSGITKDSDILKGTIQIREMKGHDEKILVTQRFLKDGTALRRVLNNCIVSEIDATELTAFDFNYLLFALRGFSYGDDYKFKQKCENTLCEREMNLECKISELKFNELPDEFVEPITLELPRSKYTIECVLFRQYHAEALKKEDAREEKKTEYDYEEILTRKMVTTTLKITAPDGKEIPSNQWQNFYNDLSAFDLAFLREKTNFGTDVEGKEVICPYCGRTQKVSIPIGTDFFRF